MLESFSSVLGGIVMPALLILCGIVLAIRINLLKILSPLRFIRTLKEASSNEGTSPLKAMCTALAGTLGVGNIAGVATAITAGGSGAVMWMWIGAIFSMSVKYGEVALAVKYRRSSNGSFYGGAMYTIRDGLHAKIGSRASCFLGGLFALMCLINSLVTGNIVQSNSAASVFRNVNPMLVGIVLAAGIILASTFGKSSITSITYALIPPLSGVYISLSLIVIASNLSLIPDIMRDIFIGAFSFKAVSGAAMGIGMQKAIRFGITRGIFSNEAGCGTAPSAHASANVKTPHHQGCFGIFEVIADTLVLCSMTAFVILIAQKRGIISPSADGVPLTLEAFNGTIGKLSGYIIGISVVLFAYATLLAQQYYGQVAIGYFTRSSLIRRSYTILSSAAAFWGTIMNVKTMWTAADIVVGIMTTINVLILLFLSREISEISQSKL